MKVMKMFQRIENQTKKEVLKENMPAKKIKDKEIKKTPKKPTKRKAKQIKLFESVSLNELEEKINEFLATLNLIDYIYTSIIPIEIGTIAFILYEKLVPIKNK